MKNKKSLIASASFGVVLIILTIIGSAFCNWAVYLLPIAFVPITAWIIKNRKQIFNENKKNVIA